MEEKPKYLKGISYLCFIPYSAATLPKNIPNNNNNDESNEDNIFDDDDSNNNYAQNDNNNNNNNDNSNSNNNTINYSYHWFQGIFISLPDKISYGLMGDTSESPPIPHPCCYPDKTCPPKFYNLTVLDYTTNKKTFIKYILQTGGDNIALSTDWEPDNFVMDERLRKMVRERPHFKFQTLSVKYNQDAVQFMKNYFPKLKPEPSCIICIGNSEIELK
ncbi:hypothetical protein H8356DRAFT_1316165 [Neocallimastix lanati (nom. inval.)]|nr:hypothetical protein H8356DRAFT_1316165 [Neocallimastix sp. JGI-2020a]